VVAPGDNDRTDCWGRYGPGTGTADREDASPSSARSSTPTTSRSAPARCGRESREAGYTDYRENTRWVAGSVLYVVLNFQGSNDNLPHAGVDGETRSDAEIARRESHARAAEIGAKGVVVAWQSDPDFNTELRRQVIAFAGQSLLVHGDSHYFKIDKPLNYDNGQVVEKFTRVETFGAANTHWVSLTVDPQDRQLFQLRPQIVPGNVNDR
jgi:hypothetical protein